MAGKKGSGVGNLNAMRHPWRVLWRRGVLPTKYAWMRPVLEAFGDGLIQDHGGADEVTTAKRALIEAAQIARGCATIIMAEAAEHGFVLPGENGKGWDLHPGVKELAKFLHLLRNTLTDLGLERRAKDLDKQIIIKRWTDPVPPMDDGQGQRQVEATKQEAGQ